MLYAHEIRPYLEEFDFINLFTQKLGWNYHSQNLNVSIDETRYQLTAVAEKQGMVAFECPATQTGGDIPKYAIRRKIHKQIEKSVYQHFIIYTNADKTTQIWQWVKHEQGKPIACRELRYDHGDTGELLVQRLRSIIFTLKEEEELTHTHVIGRVQNAFDVESVTKRFYNHFKREHDTFLKFLTAIPDEEMQNWYASIILSRLMFIYFIQKKEFLNGDSDYLHTKLRESKVVGNNRYYKAFLCPLFFEGFAKPENERSREMKSLLGKIPYLNGGIFQKHELETLHGEDIEIPDRAFERIFNFFERYQWHLDDRDHRLRKDNEINPDVLGYIFEKYINQKQMGAYYTKEDITDYISKNTIIPFLFDQAKRSCEIAFEGNTAVWQLLQENPDAYIYNDVKKGVKKALPSDITDGIGDVCKRTNWNTLAPGAYALPSETWRELIARRHHYDVVYAKLANGEIDNINELITYNLCIRQFAQEVIENCEGPELLRAFWKAINEVTILDPACGSGAFLFAALNILEPLYEACLDRMRTFLDEGDMVSESQASRKYSDFHEVIERIDKHPNQTYFILKSIIINNLYGVDIEEEAVEICKLRLFLKMVAQLENVSQIEPLPDIDFNILPGNTLVGFATYEQVKRAVTGSLDFDNTMERIRARTEDVEHRFEHFRQQQTKLNGDVSAADKQGLQNKLQVLEDELNEYLAGSYQIDPNEQSAYQNWLDSHKPFHWFIAFYGILKKGGFDVIIGNPPYVEYSEAKKKYTIHGYETQSSGNLYAYVMERCTYLSFGRIGWIVPISWVSTNRMAASRKIVSQSHPVLHISNYADRPSSLFMGVHQKLSIVLGAKANRVIHTTEFYRCYSREGESEHLFNTLAYHLLDWDGGVIRKFSSDVEASIYRKITQKTSPITNFASSRRMNNTSSFHLNLRLMMWVRCFLAPKESNEYKTYYPIIKKFPAEVLSAVFNSSLFFWFWETKGDCWHLTKGDMDSFHIDLAKLSDDNRESLIGLAKDLERDLEENKEYVGTRQTDYEYYHKKSKHIIDDIDRVLAQLYGFTDEELDFIINYAIKYRKGLE